jgi:hypothetical protein
MRQLAQGTTQTTTDPAQTAFCRFRMEPLFNNSTMRKRDSQPQKKLFVSVVRLSAISATKSLN